jgi:hypothetical protein
MFWNLKGYAIAFRVVKPLFYFLHIHLEIVLDEVLLLLLLLLNDLSAFNYNNT